MTTALSSRGYPSGPYRPPQPQPSQSSSSGRVAHPPPTSSHPPRKITPYHPTAHEMRPGPRNRLFLSLASEIPSEVDWALPRLVVASFEDLERFKLDQWIDSVVILCRIVSNWVDELELEATIHTSKTSPGTIPEEIMSTILAKYSAQLAQSSSMSAEGDSRADLLSLLLLSRMDQGRLASTTKRATEALLVLRNASFLTTNARQIARPTFISLLDRFFAINHESLLDITMEYPEPTSHILTILTSILPFLDYSPRWTQTLFNETLPLLLVETRDMSMITLILPVLIQATSRLNAKKDGEGEASQIITQKLLQHLFKMVTIQSPNDKTLLDIVLDYLVTLSNQVVYCKAILGLPTFPADLKVLLGLLSFNSRSVTLTREPPMGHIGKVVLNPASATALLEQASARRNAERAAAQEGLQQSNGEPRLMVDVEVGDKQPALSQATKNKLYAMPEPKRSITWMHETFVYSANSQLLQVVFWHAYRDFFQHPSTVEQLLSASEVIKNVTIAFPGAAARVWHDAQGAQKFVIGGMGFRKGSDEDDRYICLWRGCEGHPKHSDTASLLKHVQEKHLSTPNPNYNAYSQPNFSPFPSPVQPDGPALIPFCPDNCSWGKCSQRPFTLSHLLTHLPMPNSKPVPEIVNLHPSTPNDILSQDIITTRAVPPLSYAPGNASSSTSSGASQMANKLVFRGNLTSIDSNGRPVGCSFLAALLIRNTAKVLKSEISRYAEDLEQEEDLARRRKKGEEERYGLPIPASVLKEEEEEEAAARRVSRQSEDVDLTRKQVERAREAFESVEVKIGEVVSDNMGGLGQYLSEAFGW